MRTRTIVYTENEYREVRRILRAYDNRQLFKYRAMKLIGICHAIMAALIVISIDSYSLKGIAISGCLLIYSMVMTLFCMAYRKEYRDEH